MTCEVAVMNARGIALAADSAVTLGDARKIYLTAEKLFDLSPSVPVGIMTYSNAELSGVPWETIVGGYRMHLVNRRFGTLAEYLSDFVSFIEGETTMFPDKQQQECFPEFAGEVWYNWLARPWMDELRRDPPRDKDGPYRILRARIAEINSDLEQRPPLERFDAKFADAVIGDCDDALNDTANAVFESDELPTDVRQGLRTTLRLILSHQSRYVYSGLVIAGMGDTEHFPGLLHYSAGPVVKGRLRLEPVQRAQMTRGGNAAIMPFAQREIIDMIIDGIHPNLRANLPIFVSAGVEHATTKKVGDKILEQAEKYLEQEIASTYSSPFLGAVAVMPRQELATIAEVLVSLTAFRAHASVSPETVAGPVDVAILSKGEGFVWVKRKRIGAADRHLARVHAEGNGGRVQQ